jgi:hypothetical protein
MALCVSRNLQHNLFTLCVTGTAYDCEGETRHYFSDEMLVEKKVFIVKHFNNKATSEDDRFGTFRSMLLYQLLGLFHRRVSLSILLGHHTIVPPSCISIIIFRHWTESPADRTDPCMDEGRSNQSPVDITDCCAHMNVHFDTTDH